MLPINLTIMINKILTFCLSLLAVTAFSFVSAQNTFPNSGNAGIGTTSPSYPLEIRQPNSSFFGTDSIAPNELGLKIHRLGPNSNTDNGVGIGFGVSSLSSLVGGAIIFERNGSDSQGKLHFATKNQIGTGNLPIRMTLDQDGKLSVGTINPTPNGQITVRGNGAGGTIAILPNASDGETSVGHFSEPDGTGLNWVAGVGGWGNTGDYVIGSSDATSSGPRIVIQADGNIGIGVPTPNAKLVVDGGSSTMRVTTDENIFQNTTIPLFLDGKNGVGTQMRFQGSGGANSFIDIGKDANGDFVVERGDNNQFLIGANGNVGIGTTNPANKLDVCGTIRATEIKVESGWCDYVFEDGYLLTSLEQVKRHIAEKGYLHKTPSALEIEQAGGIELASTAVQQQEKIEEIFLHLIQLNERLKQQDDRIKNLEKENAELKSRLAND
jgi:hypothetical protein